MLYEKAKRAACFLLDCGDYCCFRSCYLECEELKGASGRVSDHPMNLKLVEQAFWLRRKVDREADSEEMASAAADGIAMFAIDWGYSQLL